MDIDRLKALSGLVENDHDDDALLDAIAREKHIEKLIRHAFEKIGLEINYDNNSVLYEDSTREASVDLEDFEADLALLNKLFTTGLSKAFRIFSRADHLAVTFIVDPMLDQAAIA